MRTNEYRKYELFVCVSIIQREGEVRAQVLAVGMCQHHTVRGLHARERVPQVRAVVMCQHHTAQGLHGRDRVPQVRGVGMCKHPQSKYERKYELLECVASYSARTACARTGTTSTSC